MYHGFPALPHGGAAGVAARLQVRGAPGAVTANNPRKDAKNARTRKASNSNSNSNSNSMTAEAQIHREGESRISRFPFGIHPVRFMLFEKEEVNRSILIQVSPSLFSY
jgi:hypothetical protein